MKRCDVCHAPIEEAFVDGRRVDHHTWSTMCLECHAKKGVGLGIGRGQKYIRVGDEWVKDAE